MSKHSTLASCVAATALLAASCSGAKQDGGSSNAASAYEQHAPNDSPAAQTASTERVKKFDVAPEIRNRCIPYLVPDEPLAVTPGQNLEGALDGVAACLSVGPLHDEPLELVQPYGDEEYSDEAVRRVTQAFERLGLTEDRLSVVYENATELVAPHITLRLAKHSS